MATDRIALEIVTPERLVLSEVADEVILPGSEGYLGVLPGHAPLLTALGSGEITYRTGEVTRHLAVSGGFVEVLRDRVSILAENCERPDEIDANRAAEDKKKAERDLAAATTEADMQRA